MIYIGIDPGQSGGIAVITVQLLYNGQVVAIPAAFKMPATEAEVWDILAQTDSAEGPRFAALERVWSSPGWGHVGAFKFGMSYGALRMALTAAGIPYDEVLPSTWQRALGCLTKGDKNISKRRAQALFPSLAKSITHATADALLIAEYVRRQRSGHGEAQQEGRPAQVEREREPEAGGGDQAQGAAVPGAAGDGEGDGSTAQQPVRGDRGGPQKRRARAR